MEPPFEKLKGVQEVISGYSGGKEKNPTYNKVSRGLTGHTEAIQITYDPSQVSYSKLLDIFWRQIDPTDPNGQFVDRGKQYRAGIFFHNKKQKEAAEKSKRSLAKSKRFSKPIVTEIVPYQQFYPAEKYHQDYYKKSPIRYKYYRSRSGRDQFLKKKWGSLKERLTPLQYKVTQEDGTETPFKNEYWDNKKEGIYVDIVSGEPLFSSKDKYRSGTGWPTFTRPLEANNILTVRKELRSVGGNSHLGHLFKDGPPPTGLRYCINSAALRFIPKEKLKKEGYAQYQSIFK